MCKVTFGEYYALLCQTFTVYAAFGLLMVLIFTALIIKMKPSASQLRASSFVIKILNIGFLSVILVAAFARLLLFIYNVKHHTISLMPAPSAALTSPYFQFIQGFNLINSILSDVIILLAFSAGLVCIYLLGEKNLVKYLSNVSIFASFLVATVIMVYTSNLLVMFIGFECLFLPTLYFAYTHSYVERSDKAIKILLQWTLLGAFLILLSLAYIYSKTHSLQYAHISTQPFSTAEQTLLTIFLFIGFGVKVPLFPFHYWLTKIHVEAPAGFSIFLSGFLVKAALYCFYFFAISINSTIIYQVGIMVALSSVTEASFKMWTQTDFKKLIAFATIQEMGLILYLLLTCQNPNHSGVVLFILVHGWLSTLMFFLVDIIQKKTKTRNVMELSGLAYKFPELHGIIWLVILLFSGFPMTVKFLAEWLVLASVLQQGEALMLLLVFVIIVVGVVGFTRTLLIILYGTARRNFDTSHTLSKRDKYLFYFIISILILLNMFAFFLG